MICLKKLNKHCIICLFSWNVAFVVSEPVIGSLSSPEDIESTQYLLKWSEIDHDEYCMALLFTYRDFNHGVLGLAWVATPDLDTPGGICTKKVIVTDEEKTINFNTAIATFQNFGIRVPRKVSVITVTHEFGHSFGSEV